MITLGENLHVSFISTSIMLKQRIRNEDASQWSLPRMHDTYFMKCLVLILSGSHLRGMKGRFKVKYSSICSVLTDGNLLLLPLPSIRFHLAEHELFCVCLPAAASYSLHGNQADARILYIHRIRPSMPTWFCMQLLHSWKLDFNTEMKHPSM